MYSEIKKTIVDIRQNISNIESVLIPHNPTTLEVIKETLDFNELKTIKEEMRNIVRKMVELDSTLDHDFEDMYRDQIMKNEKLTDSVTALQSENNHYLMLYGVSN